jgi:hypothetical protein
VELQAYFEAVWTGVRMGFCIGGFAGIAIGLVIAWAIGEQE